MSNDSDKYDFFVSYARSDNADGWITHFVNELLKEHRKFAGNDPARQLKPFFDKQNIHSFDDWQDRIYDSLTKSRLFVAFISPHYFASEWCRREWKGWIDTEIAKHILSAGAAPIYFVEVPGFVGKVQGLAEQSTMSEQQVAATVAELCKMPKPHESFAAAVAPIVRQMRDRRQVTSDFVKAFHDEGVSSLRRSDLKAALKHLARDIENRAQDVKRAAASESTVPPYNRKFSGRLDELLALRDRLKDDQAGVISGIHGLGGIGKTELAFTYAHAFASAYPGGRFLVPCEGKTNLREATLALGELFGKDILEIDRKTVDSYFAAISSCLRRRLAHLGHMLLVLDNVTDHTLLTTQDADCLTSLGPKLHLLATTRIAPTKGVGGNWITLGELPEADALDLLEKHRPFRDDSDREAARCIARRLGGFALAVELVAAWLAAHDQSSSYSKLADGLGLEDLEVIAGAEDVQLRRHNHERRLSAVLGPVLRSLLPAERRTLEYSALLPPDCVPLPWLKALVTQDFPELSQPTRLIDDPWERVCERMERLALFTRAASETAEHRVVRAHRLVQALVRQNLSTNDLNDSILIYAKERLGTLHLGEWQVSESRWELDTLRCFAEQLLDQEQDAYWLIDELGQMFVGIARGAINEDGAEYTKTLEQLEGALGLFMRLIQFDERGNAAEDLRVARHLNNIAVLLQAVGRSAGAEEMMRRALAIDEKLLGTTHPDVARDMNNLAALLQATGRAAEAEPIMRRALAVTEQSLGPDHPGFANQLNNLAQLLRSTDRTEEAERMMRYSLDLAERSYGAENHTVATRLNNLAQLLLAKGQLAEAEPLMRRALEITERSLGKNHPHMANSLGNLAQLFQETNRFAEAEPLMRRALEIDEQSYGKDHPNMAIRLNNLAQLLLATNRLAEAEPLMRRALVIDENTYGKDHPNVASGLNNLAQLLKTTNRLSEAEALMRNALSIDEKSYGNDHPRVVLDFHNLASLLYEANRLSEAEPLMRLALAGAEECYGKDHPNVASCLTNLALLLQATNRLLEAEQLIRRALAIEEESYGKDHQDVATILYCLARLFQASNRLSEAEPLVRRAITIFVEFTRATGHPHPHLEAAANNYGRLLIEMGKSKDEVIAVIREIAPDLSGD